MDEKKCFLSKVLLVAILASLVIPFATSYASATASSGATAQVLPTVVGPGNAVLVNTSLNAFTGGSVEIYLSTNNLATISSTDTLLATVPLNSNHALLNQNVTIPSSASRGYYYLKLTDDKGATVVVSNKFLVQTITPPSLFVCDYTIFQQTGVVGSQGYPGDTVRVCGSNFLPNEPVKIYLIDELISSNGTPVIKTYPGPTTDSNGNFHANVILPTDLITGTYLFVAINGGDLYRFGASATFQVLPVIYPDLYQYAPPGTQNAYNLYSVRADSAYQTLVFYGFGLPTGTLESVQIENAQGQVVATGVFPQTQTSGGVFSGPYTTAPNFTKVMPLPNNKIGVNVTIVQPLAPGFGYVAVFDISGVSITSYPFIASVPTNGLFSAQISPSSGSGPIDVQIQAIGLIAGDPFHPSPFAGAGSVVAQLLAPILNTQVGFAIADKNGAAVFSLSSNGVGIPNGTYPVELQDYYASGAYVPKVVAYYNATPSFGVQDIYNGNNPFGYVGDTLYLDGLASNLFGSFPSAFQATSVTFTSAANGYSVTVTKDANGNPISKEFYGSDVNGDFSFNISPSGQYQYNPLYIKLPALPGGEVMVTINGQIAGGRQVSIPGGVFYVLTGIQAVYYANLSTNSWNNLKSFEGNKVFSGDYLDVQVDGFPVNETGSLTFVSLNKLFVNSSLTKATPQNNGSLELIVQIPGLAPTTPSGFGLYQIYVNGGFYASTFCAFLTTFTYNITTPTFFYLNITPAGSYSVAPPHLYVDPQNITPESQLGVNKPGVFPTVHYTGESVNLLFVGFTPSAKEWVALNAYNAVTGTPITSLQYVFPPTSMPLLQTNGYGVAQTTLTLPNLTSKVYSGGQWWPVTYRLGVYEANPSVIAQTFYNAIPTNDETVNFSTAPRITVSPTSGPVGTSVTVTGTGFASQEQVTIYVQEVVVVPPSQVKTSSTGFFSATFNIPAYAAGPVSIVAIGSSGTKAYTQFTINITTPPQHPVVQVSGAPQLQPGQTQVITVTTYLNGAPTDMSSVSGTVLLPTGVTQSLSFLHVGTGEYQSVYLVPNITGTYVVTVSATASNGLSNTGVFSFSVVSITPPQHPVVQVSGAPQLQPGQTQVITVTTYLNGAPTDMSSVSGTVLLPTGVTQSLSFLHVGTGEYQSVYLVPNITGTYVVTVSATASNGLSNTGVFSFSVVRSPPTPPTPPTINTSAIISIISSQIAPLQTAISSLQSALSNLASQTSSAIQALLGSMSSLSSVVSQIQGSIGTLEAYSLGALIIAFIALIVIIYGVFVRRRM